MSRIGASVLLFVVGLAAGGAVGWVIGRESPRYDVGYRTARQVVLTDPNGQKVGELRQGVIVISSETLNPASDLGWWGYVPIAFGTMDEAARLLNVKPIRLEDDSAAMLNALSPEQVPDERQNKRTP